MMVVAKWGNSLAVRIPKRLATETGIGEGAEVELKASGHAIVIVKRRRSAKPRVTLAGLISRVTPENQHSEADWGEPLGNET